MKNTIRLVLAATLLAAVVICVTNSAALAKDAADEPAMPKGSIRVDHKVKPAGLPALARISFEQALKAALAAAPGSVIKAELEVEEGNLVYSFEVVGADKSTTEVEIDAGNGKVLATEKEIDGKEDKKD
jgi:uncharacterized membrane protein YkoI